MIALAQPGDLPVLYRLLAENHLPQDGLAEHLMTALVIRYENQIVGCAALELYSTDALLRSVAVQPTLQKRGLGHRLVQAAFDLAREHKVQRLYLLTETAGDYFPKFGFRAVERAAIPATVQQSIEFTSACPDSALAMVALM